MTEPTPRRSAALPWPAIALVVAVALGLRAVDAWHKSLWLDELHTLAIGWQDSVAGVLDLLGKDIHAPLYFLGVHAIGRVDAHLLRALSIVPGLLTLWPLLALARAAGMSRTGQLITALAFAALPYQIQYGTELRPYAWLQLCAATMAWAAFATRGSARLRFLVFAAAAHLGLWIHYFAAFAVLAAGAARLCVPTPGNAGNGSRRPLPLPWLIAGGALAAAAFLPHVLMTRRWLLTEPQVLVMNPYTNSVNVPRFATHLPVVLESLPRTLATMLGALGGWRGIAASAAVALLGLLLVGALIGALVARLRRRAPPTEPGDVAETERVVPQALVYAATAWLLIEAAAVGFLDRSDTLQYLVVMAWVWPLLLGAAADQMPAGGWRKATAWVVAAALVLAGFCHSTGVTREDLRRAVQVARGEAQTLGAMVSAAMNQRPYFPKLTVFEVYAPDLVALPADAVPAVDAPGGDRPLVVLARRMGPDAPHADHFWHRMPAGRQVVREIRIDATLRVFVLMPKKT